MITRSKSLDINIRFMYLNIPYICSIRENKMNECKRFWFRVTINFLSLLWKVFSFRSLRSEKNNEKLHSWASNELVFAPAESLASRLISCRAAAPQPSSWFTGSGERPQSAACEVAARQEQRWRSSLTHIGFRCTSWWQYCVLCALLKVAVIV